MNATQHEIEPGRWYRMSRGGCGSLLVVAIRPNGAVVRMFGAGGLSAPAQSWQAIDENGNPHEISPLQIDAPGIGGLRGPVGDLPPLTADDIRALQGKRAVQADREAREDWERAQTAAKARAELRASRPDLEPIAGNKRSPLAVGASNLRRELKAAFPGVAFAVRSKSYSGGCSINVAWEFGPTAGEVDAITNRYQTHDFDGMQDLESAIDNAFADVFGGAKYVFVERDYGTAGLGDNWWRGSILGDIGAAICEAQGIEDKGEYTRGICGDRDPTDLRGYVNRILSKATFPAGSGRAAFAGIENDPEGTVCPWRLVLK